MEGILLTIKFIEFLAMAVFVGVVAVGVLALVIRQAIERIGQTVRVPTIRRSRSTEVS